MQANQKPIKQVIKTLTKAMNDHDPDVAQMAAKDLCKNILQGLVDLKNPQNKQIAKSVTQQFLKQVGSYNFVIHSAAIRCLAEIAPKLGKQQLIYVMNSTISSITDPKTQSKRMEVFSSSASTMINLAPGDLGIQLSSLFLQCVNEFLKLSKKKTNKQQDEVIINLLHIIIDFTQKWPDVVGNEKIQFNRKQLIQLLLNNLQNSQKLELARKSDVALEKIAAIFTKLDFEFALHSKEFGIIEYVNKYYKSTDQEGLKKLRNGISCLNHLVHAHNRYMVPWVNQIAKLCINIINVYLTDSENLVLVCQILQNSISCLIQLLKAYYSELVRKQTQTLDYQFYSSFIQQILNFDLQGMMRVLSTDEGMDQQNQQEEQYYNQGTFCWKVRQISLDYTSMLMRKCQQFRQNKGKSYQFLDLLSTKLIQQNQNVSKKAFACFNYIIQSISTVHKRQQDFEEVMSLKRVKSNQQNFALSLIDRISHKIQILFHHKKTQQQAKIEAAKTLLNLIELLNYVIKDNVPTCTKVLTLIQDLLPKVKADSCVFLIRSSKTLINGMLEFQKTSKVIDSYLRMVKNNNYKIVAASFDGIRNALKHYHLQILKSGKINQILNVLLPKLKEHDADKLVKVQAIRCLGPIFTHILSNLPQNVQSQILSATQNKMKIQIDKTTILSQISRIPQNYSYSKGQQQTLKNLLQLCSSTIGNSNYQVCNLSVQACDKLIRLLKNTINQKNADLILEKSRSMLSQQKIPKFLDVLIEKFPNSLKNYSDSIVKTGDNYYIRKLIQKKIISPEKCIQILKGTVNQDNIKKLSIILSQIQPSKQKLISQINQTKWGLVSMSALGYLGDLSTVEKIQKIINSCQQNHDMKFEGARSIGNIVSRNPQFVLKLIQFSKQPHDGFLYLHALKQMLSFSQKQFPNIQKVIHFIFSKSEESDKETNKHLLAQSIGHIARISHKQQKKILDSLKDMSPARRFIVASSLRYTLQGANKNTRIEQNYNDFITKVFQLSKDADVNVREGALKSLNSIIETHSQQLRHHIDHSFMQNLFSSMTIKPQLIKIIDYGVSKEKKDLGKGLRIQAFNFLKSNILNRQVQPLEPIVGKCLQKINEQTSNDLILKRVSIIRIICSKDYTAFVSHQNDFATKVGTDGVLKSFCTGNATNDERSEGYLKGLLKQILTIAKLSTERSQSIRAMINKIATFQRLKRIMEVVQESV